MRLQAIHCKNSFGIKIIRLYKEGLHTVRNKANLDSFIKLRLRFWSLFKSYLNHLYSGWHSDFFIKTDNSNIYQSFLTVLFSNHTNQCRMALFDDLSIYVWSNVEHYPNKEINILLELRRLLLASLAVKLIQQKGGFTPPKKKMFW